MVSIHAPAGGATQDSDRFKRELAVSIHAPAGGATLLQAGRQDSQSRFNPRARGGRDHYLQRL